MRFLEFVVYAPPCSFGDVAAWWFYGLFVLKRCDFAFDYVCSSLHVRWVNCGDCSPIFNFSPPLVFPMLSWGLRSLFWFFYLLLCCVEVFSGGGSVCGFCFCMVFTFLLLSFLGSGGVHFTICSGCVVCCS